MKTFEIQCTLCVVKNCDSLKCLSMGRGKSNLEARADLLKTCGVRLFHADNLVSSFVMREEKIEERPPRRS